MRHYTVLAIILLAIQCEICHSYNILGVFPTLWKSHYIAGGALMRGLAAAGHNVSVVSPFPNTTPLANFRDIRVLGIHDHIADKYGKVNRTKAKRPMLDLYRFTRINLHITEYTLDHPVMVELMSDPNELFDVIIVEAVLTTALLGLGQHFNAPVITFSTFGATLSAAALVGTPVPMSYVPHFMTSFNDRMSFVQRVENVLMNIFDVTCAAAFDSYQEEIYNRVFPRKDKLSYAEMTKSVSLVLLNQHFSTSYPRPYSPNMIEVGGIQINRNEPKPLPDYIREFVDGAEHGVIYMSLGTNILSSELPPHVRQGILNAFRQLKERVLWKWEDTELPGKPDNVLASAWFPQDDVLAHPNVKLFITHGGLLGLSETVYHGLPVIGIPFFGDQHMNMARVVEQGYGVQVEFTNLTEASLSGALHEVLTNHTYARKARELSAVYRDQPMEPLDLARFWVEYVARHKGAPHIQSTGQILNVLQYHSVDVFGLLIGVTVVWFYLVYRVAAALCFPRKGKESKSNVKVKRKTIKNK